MTACPDITVTIMGRREGADCAWFRLDAPLLVHWGDGELECHIVPVGIYSDGASVPWFFRRLFERIGGAHLPAAIMHDWLYQTAAVPRREADRQFRLAMRHYGVGACKAWAMWAGVRLGGWVAWGQHRRKAASRPPPSSSAIRD